jgi:parallel beta-helix repeat protein
VYDCDNKGIYLISDTDVGQVTGCIVSNNIVTGCGDGIYLAGVSNSTVTGNTCTDNDNTNDAGSENYGIAFQQCQGISVVKNTVTGGAAGRSGMEVWGGSAVIGSGDAVDVDSTGMKIIGNYISGYMGPWLDASGANAFKACTAKSTGIVVCGNIFANSLRGARIGQDSTSASILANNTFENCTTDLYLENNVAEDETAEGWTVANNKFTGATWFNEHTGAGNSVTFSGNSYSGTSGTYNGTEYTTADVGDLDATKDTAAWIAGVRAYDDLPIPLHPDIGAVQDRTAPGRRFGVGGGVL